MRAIKKIIIHSTATPEGRHHTAADVCRWHRERGWKKIGYHCLIQLDGTVEKARNMAKAGAHVAGHNANSIGIAYVGGTDANLQPKDTRTREQRMALKTLVCELMVQFPDAQVLGHRDLANTACPSFDVKKEFEEWSFG